MTERTTRFAGALALVLATACSGTRAETVPLRVEVLARVVAPGEPVRIVVDSPEPLASLDGSFLEQDVAMVRTPIEGAGAGRSERWSGWTMVALDGDPGPAVVEVHGRSTDGRPAAGRLEIAVQPKEFPTEELTVASKYVSPPEEVLQRIAGERAKLAAVYARRSPYPPPSQPFARPVPGEPSSVFGTRRLFNGEPRSPHPGLDLRADTGDPILAASDGTVVIAEEFYYSGNLVILDHGGGLFTLYAHLSEIGVEEGQQVARGQPVGRVGATGRVTGPHLHWGAKIGDRPFDPMALVDEALFP